ncbi:MAG: M48 family metalloprotease [Solirubrobacteraceae bacterium]|nr:M48 family metalloprotease [Solirubrobacteraceae bacterium]MDP4673403.1 M48 family metalloprotease [Solirubrobacteraceae bacterium]
MTATRIAIKAHIDGSVMGLRFIRHSALFAVVVALLVAELLVLLMTPRSGVITPLPTDAAQWFTPAQLGRAASFNGLQLWLGIAALLVKAAVLALIVIRAPAWLRGPYRHPIIVSGLVGAAISIAVVIALLPLAALMRIRSIDYGLTTSSWGAWGWDLARSAGIAALIAAAATLIAIALIRKMPRRWWVPASALIVLGGVMITFAGPLVIDPIFNRFTPLAAGPARSSVVELAGRAGVKVGSVYVIDASRRTTAANAYVVGVGSSKRVVLYDTLLNKFPPAQTRLVVAHELAHVHYRDIPHGLIFLLIVAPFGAWAVARCLRLWGPHDGLPAGPSSVPALTAAVILIVFAITLISNQLSRSIEERADAFALTLTGDAPAFIAQQRRISIQNLGDPDPPAITHWLFGTHPTTLERIGIGLAWQRGERPSGVER